MTLTNSQIGDLLAEAATTATGNLSRALRRASRRSLVWPEEAHAIYAQGRTLTELDGVGPHLAGLIGELFDDPPEEIPQINRHPFLTYPEVMEAPREQPEWAGWIRGDLHVHTTCSDGYAPLEEMVEAANYLGYEYVAITDHSKGLRIAGGMDEERLLGQVDHIDQVNHRLAEDGSRLRVLKSVEMNIDPDGAGDMESGALGRLDLVLGSFHSKLRASADQTERFLAALSNPELQILGHPQGRMHNSRQGLSADWEAVFSRAAELDKAVEVDSFPDRQDLDVSLLEVASRHPVRISIGSDSHHPSQLRYVEYGLAAAIKARIPSSRILNFMSREELIRWVQEVRASAATMSGGAS